MSRYIRKTRLFPIAESARGIAAGSRVAALRSDLHPLTPLRLWVQRVCEDIPSGTVRGTEGTGEFERYTPAEYLDAAREVFGGQIDLCPASNAQAQKIAQAKHYFTARDNGLVQDWRGRVYLNPPYHRDLLPQFINKLHEEVDAGRTKEAILLINNTTDTDAGQKVLTHCNAVCFTDGRIKFWTPSGVTKTVLPTQGQMFAYYGPDPKAFVDVFSAIGATSIVHFQAKAT